MLVVNPIERLLRTKTDEMGSLGQRLKDARGKEPLATAAVGLGVHPNTLSKYEADKRVPDADFLLKACGVYGVEEAWLLSGRGPVGANSKKRLMELAYGIGEPAADFSSAEEVPDGFALVPVYGVEASSGHGSFSAPDDEREPLAFPRALLRRLTLSPVEKLAVVFNRGESNEPDLFDGDAMLVDRGIERMVDDAFYVFEFEGALMVKLIERYLDGRVALKARNSNYREEILSKEQAGRLTIFGRVIWRGGTV